MLLLDLAGEDDSWLAITRQRLTLLWWESQLTEKEKEISENLWLFFFCGVWD